MFKQMSSTVLAATLLTFGLAAPAHALAARAWVSGHGTDAAGCGAVANPCRSFQYVLSNIVAPGGEIDVLDPAGYGSMTITFAVNIVNGGVGTVGVIGPASGTAITINAGPTDLINLQGLTIEGQGSASTGIQFNSGGSLALSASQVFGFTTVGVNFTPNNGSGVPSSMVITGDAIYDNGLSGADITIKPQGGTQVYATLENGSDISGAQSGVISDASANSTGFVRTTITNCVLHDITGAAVTANGPSTGGAVHVLVERDDISHAVIALQSQGSNASLDISNSAITDSTSPTVVSSSGALETFGNNTIRFVTNAASFTGSRTVE